MPNIAPSESLLSGFSLEMTGKDTQALRDAAVGIPPGTRINVTFLGNESFDTRIAAARAVVDLGFTPVPHISARRLGSEAMLDDFMAALASVGASEHVFVVGGDPTEAEGPYDDSASILTSGVLQEYGVREVGISGYPEGHPSIDDPTLWKALQSKVDLLAEHGMTGSITTQFAFDVEPVLSWIEAVRTRGIDLPIRIGVPGPAGVRRLIGYATRFGVGTSASIAKKYGLSLTNLMGTAGPDRFLHELSEQYDGLLHGDLGVHFYTFGGLGKTSQWIANLDKETGN